MKYTVETRAGKVIEFDSELDLHKAYEVLKAQSSRSPFASNLISSYLRHKKGLTHMTPNTRIWLIKCAQDVLDKQKVEAEDGPLKTLFEPFDAAKPKKLILRVGDLRLYKAKDSSINQGHLYVNYKGAYEGKISPSGHLWPASRGASHELMELLTEVATDPIAAALKHGRETGQCSVCGRQLSDPVSLFGGVGPTCLARIAGSDARKALERAFKEENPQLLTDALRRAKRVKERGAKPAAPPAPEPKREDFKSESDWLLAKSLCSL